VTLAKKSLDVAESNSGPDHPDVSSNLDNMALPSMTASMAVFINSSHHAPNGQSHRKCLRRISSLIFALPTAFQFLLNLQIELDHSL